jgi:beta-glucosidase
MAAPIGGCLTSLVCRLLGRWCAGGDRSRGGESQRFYFPKDFRWGAGTSAYQIEGAWNEDGKGESIWDRFSHDGRVDRKETGDVACDHYHRWRDDIQLMRRLNLNTYRFSISWPRVQPAGEGAFNPKGFAFYDRLIDTLLEHGIDPNITLYHWDLPQALQEKYGGWASRDVTKLFADYGAACIEKFSDRVSMWSTHNEPICTSWLGYGAGVFAPGLKDEKLAKQVAHHLLLSHGQAVQAARAAARKPVQLGIVLNLGFNEPYRPDNAEDVAKAFIDWRRECGYYLDPIYRGVYHEDALKDIGDIRDGDMQQINQPIDWLGINYYARNISSVIEIPAPLPGSQYSDFGWEVSPQGLRGMLTRITKEYGAPPLYVTENGAYFNDVMDKYGNVHDRRRKHYFREHVKNVALAIKDGANVKGYIAWSLMDNFEWASGYNKTFGITHVDFATQKRTVKSSGRWFSKTAARNWIDM